MIDPPAFSLHLFMQLLKFVQEKLISSRDARCTHYPSLDGDKKSHVELNPEYPWGHPALLGDT